MRRMWMMGCALAVAWAGAAPLEGQRATEQQRQLERIRMELAARSQSLQAAGPEVLQLRSRVAQQRLALGSLEFQARTAREVQRSARAVQRAGVEMRVRAQARELERQARASALPDVWFPQDPADSLYREARARLNARAYADAARGFSSIRSEYPRSGYVPDAYYFEALARYRMGARTELQRALELLAAQRSDHPEAVSGEEARALAVRIEAQLARRGDAGAAESLLGAARGEGSAQVACDEEDQELRATALSALLQMDESRARPILMEVLRSRDECSSHLRAQAVFILAHDLDGEADPATVELLLDLALREPDPDPEVREAAVFWLAQTGSDQAVDALVALLGSESATREMTEQVMFALGQTDSPRAVEVMREMALDPGADRELRANAIFWLTQMGEASPTFLRSLYDSLDDPELKERIFFSIAESGGEGSLAWLTARALDEAEAVEVRTMALFWAAEAGLSAQQALQIYRTSEDRELREQAIFVLTQVADDEEAVDALMEIARSEEDPEVRQRAIFWLGESDDPRVADFLMEIIRGGGGGQP